MKYLCQNKNKNFALFVNKTQTNIICKTKKITYNMHNYVEDMKITPTNFVKVTYKAGSYQDVEIRVQGGWILKAHSSVLAASSTFLENCLNDVVPGKTPVICLPEVRSNIMEYILTYIYTGEVRLSKRDLKEFSSVSSVLQMKFSDKNSISSQVNDTSGFAFEGFDAFDENDDPEEDAINDTDDDVSSQHWSTTAVKRKRSLSPVNDDQYDENDDLDLARTETKSKKSKPKKQRVHFPCKIKGTSQIVAENIPYFKERAERSIWGMMKTMNLLESDKLPTVEIQFKADPLYLKAKHICQLCGNFFTIGSRLTQDKSQFIHWDTSNFKKHLNIHVKRAGNNTSTSNTQDTSSHVVFMQEFKADQESKDETVDSDYNDITTENISTFKSHLIKAISKAVTESPIEQDPSGYSHKINVKIIGNPPKLKGVYQCFICKDILQIPYSTTANGDFKKWLIDDLKLHFETEHGTD